MARRQCHACKQFYGPAVPHACPLAGGPEAPQAAASGLPRSPAAPGSPVPAAPAPPGGAYIDLPTDAPLAPGEAQYYAARVARAMRDAAGSEDSLVVVGERAAVEARFGPVDWQS